MANQLTNNTERRTNFFIVQMWKLEISLKEEDHARRYYTYYVCMYVCMHGAGGRIGRIYLYSSGMLFLERFSFWRIFDKLIKKGRRHLIRLVNMQRPPSPIRSPSTLDPHTLLCAADVLNPLENLLISNYRITLEKRKRQR